MFPNLGHVLEVNTFLCVLSSFVTAVRGGVNREIPYCSETQRVCTFCSIFFNIIISFVPCWTFLGFFKPECSVHIFFSHIHKLKDYVHYEALCVYMCVCVCSCSEFSTRCQDHLALFLDIPSTSHARPSLQEALNCYMRPDVRELKCGKCSGQRSMVETAFTKLPRYDTERFMWEIYLLVPHRQPDLEVYC
jgi:hypothetical protein